jgi:CHAT domain-containing protein/Tfp pilus assembly protein PilF
MRFGILLLIGLLFILGQSPVLAQAETDTLGLTGTMADTVVARRLWERSKKMMKDGKNDEAFAIANSSKTVFEKILGYETKEVADCLHEMGSAKLSSNKYDEAINLYYQSLNINVNIFGENHMRVCYNYVSLGIAYSEIIEYNSAIKCYQKAIEICDSVIGSNRPTVAGISINLGSCYNQIGDYDKAIKLYKRAYNILIKQKTIKHFAIAAILNNIGNCYESKYDFEKAIEYHLKSLEIKQKYLPEKYSEIADSYNNLGVCYQGKKNFEEAIEYHLKSLKIKQKIIENNNFKIGQSLLNVGICYIGKKDFDAAADYLNKAINNSYFSNNEYPPELGMCYSGLGTIYFEQQQYEKAIEKYEESIKVFKKKLGENHPEVSGSLYNIGNAFMEKHQYDKAIESHLKALAARTYCLGVGNPSTIESLTAIAKTFNLANQLDSARFFSRLSLEAIQQQQALPIGIEIKKLYQFQNLSVFELAILLEQKSTSIHEGQFKSFNYSESAKANLLKSQIREHDALAFAGIPDSLLDQEHKLRIDITWREKQRQGLLDKGLAETDTNVLRIGSIVFDLKQQYEALKKRFETEYPEYFRLKYDLSTVSLSYVQDTLLQKDQALLEYFTGDSSIFLFVVRPDTMIVREVKRDFPLEDWIEGLRYGIYGYYAADKAVQTDSLKADAKRNYLEFAPKLYQKLVAPVAQHLPEKVILVPDGPLGYIPFDALLTAAPEDANDFKSYPYLIQQHQFSYTYSATLLREMRDKKHRREPEYDFVAFAPFYNGDTTLLAGMYSYDDLMRKDLQPLAFSGPEVAAASKLMKGETVAGAAATEARFTATAGNYRILHLATHGRADNRVGDYAFLAFTEIKDSLENELLYVKDLYNLQLNADLVVLSACETGIGKLQRGEGIISLARAFAYAGAKSIVTSLWSVNDKSTSELMRFFYRELRRGKEKDEALRLARQRFLKESSVKNSHPFFWAAFVPLGDMRGVK